MECERGAMPRVEAVIWDWNGTLLDDVGLCLDIANEILHEYGLAPVSAARYREIFDFPVQRYWERAGVDFARVEFEELSLRFCARFEERLHAAPLFAAAGDTLAAVGETGARQFLLSNTEHEALRRMTQHFALADRFHAVRGMSNTLATGKASGGEDLLERFGLERSTTVMIGDTAHDAEVAAELGVACILVATGHHAASRLAQADCPVVDSLEAVPATLFER